jgi:SAM-dependent methyltransferase
VPIDKPFSRREAESYWKGHGAVARTLDFEADPEGLGIACHVGAPGWLNRYHGVMQRRIFTKLLSSVVVRPGGFALDIGCGAGRWCRILAERGFNTTGIDVQDELLQLNQRRMPAVRFINVAIQDFEPLERFDVISSVTVLQHLPYVEQVRAIDRIAGLSKLGTQLLLMENVADRASHVFANSIEDWIELFVARGFELVELLRYDYSLSHRALTGVRGRNSGRGAADLDQTSSPGRSSILKHLYGWSQRGAVTLDKPVEAFLERRGSHAPCLHCGFLFRFQGDG